MATALAGDVSNICPMIQPIGTAPVKYRQIPCYRPHGIGLSVNRSNFRNIMLCLIMTVLKPVVLNDAEPALQFSAYTPSPRYREAANPA
jgi:hypothetical protein